MRKIAPIPNKKNNFLNGQKPPHNWQKKMNCNMSCVSGYNLEKIQNEIRWLYTGQYLEWFVSFQASEKLSKLRNIARY